MATPGKPRLSALPTPGRVSSIPTPGRSRSSSSVYQTNPPAQSEDISRAFADAIKANDPSQHRNISLSTNNTAASLSPQSGAFALSGRRSVAGRPSSAASTSSLKVQERAKTPTSGRIASRPASRQSDASSRIPKGFEVGDNVRIESLGFEGTLRYLGEIDGKPGLWAGVELSGGFAGKGKNDGAVAGKQYFSCPEKCGVFVATTKLSPPTVGPGAQRPSSVASSRGGRTTPAPSGRATPSFLSSTTRTPSTSFSNGRITPSTNGRVTPSSTVGRTTPGTHLVGKRVLKTPVAKANDSSLSDKITAGSRASKYMTMTAQQLNSRGLGTGADSPTRKSTGGPNSGLSSPSISRTLSSPTRPSGSPFTTPKALTGRLTSIGGATPSSPSLPRSRPSMNTPRARVPSAVSMPPPPSPKISQIQTSTSRDSTSSPFSNVDDSRSRATGQSASRPGSSASFRSAGTDELSLVEQLQSRLDALEYENERLRVSASAATDTPAKEDTSSAELEQLQLDRQQAVEKTTELEVRLSELDRDLQSRDAELQALRAEKENLTVQLTDAKAELDESVASHEQDVAAKVNALEGIQHNLQESEQQIIKRDRVIETQSAEIEDLKSNLEKTYAELEEEKKELGAQIDELRIAGQETIALYEERLSEADSQRYELEQRCASLESKMKVMASSDGVKELASHAATSATEIDNETLREQVQHLQRKSSQLEEQLEDARAALERDVTAYQDRIGRIRHEEEQRKRDFVAKTREVDQLLKSEAHARGRVEEIEEALRESTVALENARGEVESLRAELTNLDVLLDDTTEGDITSRLASFIKQASVERVRYQQDIARLEDAIRESRGKEGSSVNGESEQLKEQVIHLQDRVTNLMHSLDDRTSEVEALRKRLNRDATTNGAAKSESSIVRGEVAGLKHIVQELQKENLTATQRIKILESENQLLASETEQLRQEVQILEDNMNDSLREGDTSIEPSSSSSSDFAGVQRQSREQRIRFENELDQMRKRLSETEMKHARIVHDLNKEISELEALVESKIYREDELEQELERLKEKMSRHKKSSKNGHDGVDKHRLSTASTSTVASETSLVSRKDDEVCEICERPGHDIFNCSLLKEDVGMRGPKEVFCTDCESPGHTAAECPHSADVF